MDLSPQTSWWTQWQRCWPRRRVAARWLEAPCYIMRTQGPLHRTNAAVSPTIISPLWRTWNTTVTKKHIDFLPYGWQGMFLCTQGVFRGGAVHVYLYFHSVEQLPPAVIAAHQPPQTPAPGNVLKDTTSPSWWNIKETEVMLHPRGLLHYYVTDFDGYLTLQNNYSSMANLLCV